MSQERLSRMKIAAILFDLDETLHSREAAFWAWIREESGAHAIDLERVAVLDARGRGSKVALLDYLGRNLRWPEASLDDRLRRFRAGISRHVSIDPRVPQMLGRLRSKFRLGIVSNGTSASQWAKIHAFGLSTYFDPILISEEVGSRKPGAEIFWLASDYWSIAPAHILVVGDDEDADIGGAMNAGMQALLIAPKRAPGPDSIQIVTDLERWLSLHDSPASP
jgi:putative hydrolase of the HAD superfamily